MPSSFHFYADTFKSVDQLLTSYVTEVATAVIGAISPVATTLVAIYVMLWGWSMMRGIISEPITDGVQRIVRLGLITGLALSIGNYNGYVSDFLWKSPEALAKIVAPSKGVDSVSFLDNLMSQIFDLGDAYWQVGQSSNVVPDLGMIFIAIIVWALGLIATGYAAFLLVLSKMALAVLLGIGPIFILMAIFEPTKKFLDAWIGQSVNYVFLTMLTAASIKIMLTILEQYLMKNGEIVGDPSVQQAFPAIVLCTIAMLVMMQMPSIASGLAGGVAVGTLGAVNWAYNRAKGAASGGTNLASGKTLSDMRGARRQKTVNQQWAERNPGRTAQIYRKITGSNVKKNEIKKAS